MPPRAPFRRRLIRHVRTALDRLNLPQDLSDFIAAVHREVQKQTLRDWPENTQEYFVAMSEADPMDLFAAFVAFEVHELTYRDLQDFRTVPAEWLAGSKLQVYKARQLRTWINCVITRGKLSTSNGARWQHAKAIEFLLVLGSIRPQRWAGPLAVRLADVLRKKMVDEKQADEAKKAARTVAAYRRLYPYGPPDLKTGCFDIYRAPEDDEAA